MNKKITYLIIISISLILIIIQICLILFKNNSLSGEISFIVYDGFSNIAIENAIIVIPGEDITVKTDENGQSPLIKVPIYKNRQYENILSENYGTVSAIIYKENYKPYALFYINVYADKKRENIIIYLFEDDANSNFPFSIVEAPPNDAVKSLIERYNPYN